MKCHKCGHKAVQLFHSIECTNPMCSLFVKQKIDHRREEEIGHVKCLVQVYDHSTQAFEYSEEFSIDQNVLFDRGALMTFGCGILFRARFHIGARQKIDVVISYSETSTEICRATF